MTGGTGVGPVKVTQQSSMVKFVCQEEPSIAQNTHEAICHITTYNL